MVTEQNAVTNVLLQSLEWVRQKEKKIRACYQHACLKWVSEMKMTNQSLRERFKIEDQNGAINLMDY